MTASLETFARQGRSFHFASRLLAEAERERVAAVYAFCRATDDIVDEAPHATAALTMRRLDDWEGTARDAYAGRATGVLLVDTVMQDMRDASIPFRYVEELIAGMRMDVMPRRYRDFAELGTYAYRVAGVVGLWMTGIFGVRDPWMQERAVALGRAMQLTNIVRDVGEDWDRGRVYLPESLLRSYGVTAADLASGRAGTRPISPAYRAMMEAMMTTADADYRRAFEAVPLLPPSFRRTVAVAASVYRGIHGEVRAAGYDTLRRRAVTSFTSKCVLAVQGLRLAHAPVRPAQLARGLGA